MKKSLPAKKKNGTHASLTSPRPDPLGRVEAVRRLQILDAFDPNEKNEAFKVWKLRRNMLRLDTRCYTVALRRELEELFTLVDAVYQLRKPDDENSSASYFHERGDHAYAGAVRALRNLESNLLEIDSHARDYAKAAGFIHTPAPALGPKLKTTKRRAVRARS